MFMKLIDLGFYSEVSVFRINVNVNEYFCGNKYEI